MNKRITVKLMSAAMVGVGALCLASSSASAVSVSPADVPNQTYVIGTHMFTREITADYPGYVTTASIMLSAKSIAGNGLDDMRVYYKTARGIWVDGLTNSALTISTDFDINYKNFKTYRQRPNLECNPDATTIDEAVCMQDMNAAIKSTMVAEKQYQLYDSRDWKMYYIAKLADNNVWMTKNLALDLDGETLPLTPATSDVASSWTIDKSFYTKTKLKDTADYTSKKSYNLGEYYYNPEANSEWNNCALSVPYNRLYSYDVCADYGFQTTAPSEGGEHYAVGNMYQWSAAVAGTGDDFVGGNAAGSICPKGWRLPNGSTSAGWGKEDGYSFDDLMEAYYEDLASKPTSAPFYFTPIGYIQYNNYSIISSAGSEGDYLTSVARDYDHIEGSSVNAFSISKTYHASISLLSRKSAGSVRCVAR